MKSNSWITRAAIKLKTWLNSNKTEYWWGILEPKRNLVHILVRMDYHTVVSQI